MKRLISFYKKDDVEKQMNKTIERLKNYIEVQEQKTNELKKLTKDLNNRLQIIEKRDEVSKIDYDSDIFNDYLHEGKDLFNHLKLNLTTLNHDRSNKVS
jgi:hypothetical protein